MKNLLLSGLVLLLGACGVAQTATPFPTPAAINLIYPLDLQPWADSLGGCAAANPLAAVYFLPRSTENHQLQAGEIALELGVSSIGDENLSFSQVGWEQVGVIVNRENILSTITLDQLQAIYTGRAKTWENSPGRPVEVWVLPDRNPTRSIFDQVILPEQRLTSEAMLAPDPSAMLEAIAQASNAIGYLPGSFLTSGDPAQTARVKAIPIEGLSEDGLRAPVIALTLGEPQGIIRQLLVCLQADNP